MIKQVNSKNIKGNIQSGKFDYFELKFKIDNIPENEVKDIVLALRDNLKYFKLKSGEFLDLEEIELKNFLIRYIIIRK